MIHTCILLSDTSIEFPSFVHANWYKSSMISSITTTVQKKSTVSSPESPVMKVGDVLTVTVGATCIYSVIREWNIAHTCIKTFHFVTA